MGLDFDISSTPPDTANITAAREEFAAERQRLRELNKRFLIVIGVVLAIIVSFLLLVAVPLVSRPDMEGSFVFMIVYALPYFFFTVFVVGNTKHHHLVDVPQKALRLAEAALEQAEPEEISELLAACQAHAPLGTYQTQVAYQGRALFKGELDAMRHWLETHT